LLHQPSFPFLSTSALIQVMPVIGRHADEHSSHMSAGGRPVVLMSERVLPPTKTRARGLTNRPDG